MKGIFIKFEKRMLAARWLKSILASLAAGALSGGAALALIKLELIRGGVREAATAGAVAVLAAFLITFFALRTSRKRLAERLDRELLLEEKVSTMVAFSKESGEMTALQRADAEMALLALPKGKLRAKRVWIYILALCIGASALAAAIVMPEKEPYAEPEVIVPFEISEMQLAGIEELIKYVDNSEMEEPYRGNVRAALVTLLDELKAADTEPEMQASLAAAFTAIAEATYDSSSQAEILNALWATEDSYLRTLAKTLNNSFWNEPDWGDFAEKYDALRSLIATVGDGEIAEGTTAEKQLCWVLESMVRKGENALSTSDVAEDDKLYAVILSLFCGDDGEGGLWAVCGAAEGKNLNALRLETDGVLGGLTDRIFAVISAQKINTNVGEYVMKRLEMLFGMPAPSFERPAFSQNGSDSSEGEQDKEDEDGPSSGGVGEGVIFGSDDLVLDPLTGEYVEYGELLARYNSIMNEKLGDDGYGYTDAQKKAIEKYFALLYGGFKNQEDN